MAFAIQRLLRPSSFDCINLNKRLKFSYAVKKPTTSEAPMDLGIAGRVAIVAAASSGLGKATALELAREGVRVTITARREDELRRASDVIASSTGAEVLAIAGDLHGVHH